MLVSDVYRDKLSLIDHVKNEELLHRVKKEKNILHTVVIRLARLVTPCVGSVC